VMMDISVFVKVNVYFYKTLKSRKIGWKGYQRLVSRDTIGHIIH